MSNGAQAPGWHVLAASRLPWRLVAEWISPGEACVREATEVLAVGRTRFQEYMVAVLGPLGKSLVLDGKVQSSLLDEHWYHEALVHPVLLAHPCPRRVLVVGGGEGATLREVLKHRCVEEAVMVDIDGELLDVAKRLLPEWHQGAFENPRARVLVMDGRRFLEEAGEKGERFDAVILDLVDPMEGGPAAKLYTVEFYRLVKSVLTSDGIMVTQATSPTLTPEVYATIRSTVAAVYTKTTAYITYVRSYNGLWGFVAGSDTVDPSKLTAREVDRLIRERIAGKLRFYDGETHEWMFNLPKPIREALAKTTRIATDENPITVPV